MIELLVILDALVKQRECHYTIFKFTTHYKVMIGTPNLDTGGERESINQLPKYKTLEDAIFALILELIRGE